MKAGLFDATVVRQPLAKKSGSGLKSASNMAMNSQSPSRSMPCRPAVGASSYARGGARACMRAGYVHLRWCSVTGPSTYMQTCFGSLSVSCPSAEVRKAKVFAWE